MTMILAQRVARSRPFPTAVLVLLLALTVASCGSDGGDGGGGGGGGKSVTPKRDGPPNLVTDAEINAQPARSPERALMQWWQAAQFQDVDTTLRLTSKRTVRGVGRNSLARVVAAAGSALGRLKVVEHSTSGKQANVRVLIVTYRGQTNQVGSKLAFTFAMQRRGKGWAYDTPVYIRRLASAYGVRPGSR